MKPERDMYYELEFDLGKDKSWLVIDYIRENGDFTTEFGLEKGTMVSVQGWRVIVRLGPEDLDVTDLVLKNDKLAAYYDRLADDAAYDHVMGA
jgi:hypothetical protein